LPVEIGRRQIRTRAGINRELRGFPRLQKLGHPERSEGPRTSQKITLKSTDNPNFDCEIPHIRSG
jgi:hypothetical protein